MTFRFKPLNLIYAVVFGTPILFTATYLIAASEGHVSWCIPPITGCTTITETGIRPPESYIFRFGGFPLITFMGLLFYFFKEWLEKVAGHRSGPAQTSFYLALLACIFMGAAMAVMQGTEHTLKTLHAIFAVLFFVLMLVSQVLYTWEDFKLRQIESKSALWIRVGTNLLQFAFLMSASLRWIIMGVKPNAAYEWLVTLSYLLWYSSFIFERETVFTESFRKSKR